MFDLSSPIFVDFLTASMQLAGDVAAPLADDQLFSSSNIIAFLTLSALEIVLGIDNVIFVAILAGKLPEHQQENARRLGIGLSVLTRILLLFAIAWVVSLTEPWFSFLGHEISGKSLILLSGGLFLIGKSTFEIHHSLEGEADRHSVKQAAVSFTSIIVQIIIIDLVFSLDSVITAVGISGVMPVMVTAILIAAAIMLFAAGAISRFVEKHPTMKILALSFLILIGSLLVIEGWNPEAAHELSLKNYAYFAMAFSVLVELVNLRVRGSRNPVHLHGDPLPIDRPRAEDAPATAEGQSDSESPAKDDNPPAEA
jgi:predicted tellurium resistance membrane protein TerC